MSMRDAMIPMRTGHAREEVNSGLLSMHVTYSPQHQLRRTKMSAAAWELRDEMSKLWARRKWVGGRGKTRGLDIELLCL